MVLETPATVQYLAILAERTHGMRDHERADDFLNELRVEQARVRSEELRSLVRRRLWLLPPARA